MWRFKTEEKNVIKLIGSYPPVHGAVFAHFGSHSPSVLYLVQLNGGEQKTRGLDEEGEYLYEDLFSEFGLVASRLALVLCDDVLLWHASFVHLNAN